MSRIATTLGAARRRLPFLAPAAVIVALGLMLCGQGLWIPAKAMLAQALLERAFERSLATGRPVKPWPWADTWPVARITFPRLRRTVIVLDSASGQALAFGPGHVAGTPDAGDRGTAVYAAHRDTHFALLSQMKTGDEIQVDGIDGRHSRFWMVAAQVVRWDASGVDPHAPARALALATCWPFDAKTHGPLRYLVWATLSKPTEAASVKPPTILKIKKSTCAKSRTRVPPIDLATVPQSNFATRARRNHLLTSSHAGYSDWVKSLQPGLSLWLDEKWGLRQVRVSRTHLEETVPTGTTAQVCEALRERHPTGDRSAEALFI